MQVLIVNGKPRTGKTTFGKLLSDFGTVVSYSSIELIKEIADKYSNLGEEIEKKTDNYRLFLAEMKQIFMKYTTSIEDNIHINYQLAKDAGADYFLIDIREPEEIKYYQEKYEALTVYIYNDRVDNEKWSSDADNLTEFYEYDVYIDNSGNLENFKLNIKDLIVDR